jgi:hypothetical protein
LDAEQRLNVQTADGRIFRRLRRKVATAQETKVTTADAQLSGSGLCQVKVHYRHRYLPRLNERNDRYCPTNINPVAQLLRPASDTGATDEQAT